MSTVRRLSLALVSVLAAACTSPDPSADEPDGGGGGGSGSGSSLPPAVTDVLDLPDQAFGYGSVELPAHFQTPRVRGMDNTPAANPTTDDGATLGRVLFYDPELSANRTVSCSSCHDQAHAFADPARFSAGFAGGHTTRNSMAVTDARFYAGGRFFWDERAPTLEAQVLLPIQNEVEMGLTLDELVARVAAAPYYAPLFERAFGDATVTSERIARALAQFSRALVSYRSRYDVAVAATGDVRMPSPGFTAEEEEGKQLFLGRAGCAGCHLFNGPPQPGPLGNQAVFFIDIATNNGLDAALETADDGVGDQTAIARDLGRFKSPSLRNVELTAPYMHDGRFATLEEVIEHYRTGVQAHPNLDPRLRVPGGAPRNVPMTDAEAAALVAFLRTLTDDALTADRWFSDPFR